MTDWKNSRRRPEAYGQSGGRSLLDTDFMKRAELSPDTDLRLQELAAAKSREKAAARRQGRFAEESTDDGVALVVAPAAPAPQRRPYGPHENKDRWLDMSGKLPGWVRRSQYGITPAIGAVLFTICRELRAREKVRIAFDAIAAYAGTSQKTVERAVQHLERVGLIHVGRSWSDRWNRRAGSPPGSATCEKVSRVSHRPPPGGPICISD